MDNNQNADYLIFNVGSWHRTLDPEIPAAVNVYLKRKIVRFGVSLVKYLEELFSC